VIAVALVFVQFFVDERDDRNRAASAIGLRDQTIADSGQYFPLGLGQETPVRCFIQPLLYDGAGLVVPGRRIPFVENIVGWEAMMKLLAHCGASINLMAPSPANATPLNDGGAGSGGPFSKFWLQL
jgi:hypothetical protein